MTESAITKVSESQTATGCMSTTCKGPTGNPANCPFRDECLPSENLKKQKTEKEGEKCQQE